MQLQILDLENWRKNSETKKLKHQFEKFLMEWGPQSRTARCGLPEWPDDPCRLRRQRLQNMSCST